MTISCIVAVAHDNIIGKDNDIPWYLPADLQYFKKVTMGKPIIMGRKCFDSIGRPLPKRTNIIMTRDPYLIVSNCLMAHDLQEALTLADETGATEAFIIGGGAIYDLSQELWDKLYLTEVDVKVDGDIYFPKIEMKEWKLISQEDHQADEKNAYDYTFKVFERK